MQKKRKEAPKVRELFVEELAEVKGGGPGPGGGCCYTTMACCEEGPDGCCDLPIAIDLK